MFTRGDRGESRGPSGGSDTSRLSPCVGSVDLSDVHDALIPFFPYLRFSLRFFPRTDFRCRGIWEGDVTFRTEGPWEGYGSYDRQYTSYRRGVTPDSLGECCVSVVWISSSWVDSGKGRVTLDWGVGWVLV